MKLKHVAIGTVLFAGMVTPSVPTDMSLKYSYEIPCSVFSESSSTASTTVKTSSRFEYIPNTCSGTAYISVFEGLSGEKKYVEIPQSQYRAMGKFGGFSHNPVKKELLSPILAITQRASAAVARTAHVNAAHASGATSFTYAVNCSGGNALGVGSFDQVDSAGDTTGVTYNGSAMTLSGTTKRPSDNRELKLWGQGSPAAGSNNVVISRGGTAGSLFGTAICYSGTDTAVGIPTAPSSYAGTTNGSSASSVTVTLSNAAGSANYAVALCGPGFSGTPGGTGATYLSNDDIFGDFESSPLPASANQGMTANCASAGDVAMIQFALKQTASVSAPPYINVNFF